MYKNRKAFNAVAALRRAFPGRVTVCSNRMNGFFMEVSLYPTEADASVARRGGKRASKLLATRFDNYDSLVLFLTNRGIEITEATI